MNYGVYEADDCPVSMRVDGPKHSWKFEGDDPYVTCVYCHETRDALTGRVIRPADVSEGGDRE